MTNKSTGIQTKVPGVFVEVSPALAKERGVKTGSLVRLVSPFGALKLRALVTNRVKANELYLPMNSTDNETAINFLTGPAVDTRTNTPAYKQTKVRMEVLEVEGKIRCQKRIRVIKRHPQSGIEVHRKWRVQGMCI